MIIDKILNNNVAVILDENDKEKIVMGRGIAYKKRAGDQIDDDKIDKTFALSNPDTSHKLQELIVDIPLEYVTLSEEIIVSAKTKLGKKLNDTIYISLMDHIYTAIVRCKEGIVVKNALLWDIRRFYVDEYAIGVHALKMIEKTFGVALPEDEAGFIALHITNAEMEETVNDIYEITKVMQEVSNIVKYVFNIEFNEDSVYYYRFITHLKFFAQRVVTGKQYDEQDDELLDVIKLKYKNAYQCVKKIDVFITKKYNYELSNEEKMYLTIHIERVVYKTNK
ncbi:MAG: BglG family transcription antiterminator LicT [Coprobacillaceae bacterium]